MKKLTKENQTIFFQQEIKEGGFRTTVYIGVGG
jgi:hypothetical protein